MLQRQIMFKQLEELQRQKKLQELNDSRQQNIINQQSLLHNKQTSGSQYAPLINGTPVRDASQMFMFGNTNLVQGFQNGLPYSQQAQNQVLHSIGLASQPIDGHSLSRFSHFQMAAHESTGEQVETISKSSMSDLFNVSCQERNIMGGQTGNDQQEQDFTSLDPLEQKFLFNTDDDSLGGFGNMFEDTDNSQAFPSIQSGSWSALMQSALEETSSTDTGVQEEWSGLSFQNPDYSNDNQPSNIIDSGKNTTLWQNNIFQNSIPDTSPQVHKISRPKAETENAFTLSNNSSVPQYIGSRLAPQSQSPAMNYFDFSQISQQTDPSLVAPLKDKDDQRSSIFEGQPISNSVSQPNVWIDIPSQQKVYSKMETLKNEKTDSDIKVHQLTSMPQLTSVYENYKTLLSAAREDVSQPFRNSSFVQMNLANTSQYGSVMPVTGANSFAVNQLSSLSLQHLNVPNQDLGASHSKKRKFPTFELLPWHKEATKGSSSLQDMSIAELKWAHATNRVPEKLKEEGEALGDSVHPKKRIILTTKLMQVLFQPAPAAILTDDATECINTVTYFAARLALGDACSLTNHPHMPCDISESSSGKKLISKSSSDQNLSKIVEDFIDRAKKLEDDLLRLENKGSVLEIIMESQDLERFSVINRFAKFHSRAQMVATETASSGGPKLYPQRYVTASQMPKMVPEGHTCLSL